jgi:hypothetical protein
LLEDLVMGYRLADHPVPFGCCSHAIEGF